MRSAPNFIDQTGHRVGRLTIVSWAGTVGPYGRRRSTWNCICDCGNHCVMRIRSKTQSCGCLQRERAAQHYLTHGHSRRGRETRTNRIWRGMLARCSQHSTHWPEYGARGIIVCNRWRTYENFLADMGEAPDGLTIDRIDNDGNYEPGNCRWATRLEQNNNKRYHRHLTIDGRTMTITQWSRESGVNTGTIHNRLKRGMEPRNAVFNPPRPAPAAKQELQVA